MAVISVANKIISRSMLVGNPAYKPSFESIATATGTGSSGVLTLSSIPSTYKHLQIRLVGDNNNSVYARLSINSDTTVTNYRTHSLAGNGSVVSSSAYAQTYAGMVLAGSAGFVSGTPSAFIIDILDYLDNNKYKTIRALGGIDINGAGGAIDLDSCLWLSTSAITSITLTANAGSWSSTTKMALYGVKG